MAPLSPPPDPLAPHGQGTAPVVEFFHDVVCGWCYVMSPRLRLVAGELGLQIRHRSFVLQASREEMIRAFGSMERAKHEILGHWQSCAQHDDYDRIDVEGMRREAFEYPSGLAGALACQAAELLGGDTAHWDLFDAIQHAHLSRHRNIADAEVLLDIAVATGFERNAFASCMEGTEALQRVARDRARAQELNIRSIPTLVGAGGLRLQTTPVNELRARLAPLASLCQAEA